MHWYTVTLIIAGSLIALCALWCFIGLIFTASLALFTPERFFLRNGKFRLAYSVMVCLFWIVPLTVLVLRVLFIPVKRIAASRRAPLSVREFDGRLNAADRRLEAESLQQSESVS